LRVILYSHLPTARVLYCTWKVQGFLALLRRTYTPRGTSSLLRLRQPVAIRCIPSVGRFTTHQLTFDRPRKPTVQRGAAGRRGVGVGGAEGKHFKGDVHAGR